MSGRVLTPTDATRDRERTHRPREPRVLVLEVAAALSELPVPAPYQYGAPQLREHVPRLTQLRGVTRASGPSAIEAVRVWAKEAHASPTPTVRAVLAYVLADVDEAAEVLRLARGSITPPPAAVLALEDAPEASLVAEAGAWLAKDHGRDLLARGPFVLAALEARPDDAATVVLAWLDAFEALAKTAPSHGRRDAAGSVGQMLDLVVCVGTPAVASRMATLVGKASARADVARFFKRFPELAEDALRAVAKGRGKVRDAAVAMLAGLTPAIEEASSVEASSVAEASPTGTTSSPTTDAPCGIDVLDQPPWRSWARSGLLVLEHPPMPTFDLPPEATARHDREAWCAKLPSVARQVIFSSRAAFPVAHAWLASRAERAAAEEWLTTFAPIALYGLLPHALGEPGPSRTQATRALRFVWRSIAPERGPKVIERWCDDAGGERAALVPAITAVLEAPPRWDCPSSPPSWPSWLAEGALPPVRTKDGAVLSARARKHLVELMIVAGGASGGGDRATEYVGVEEARVALDPSSLGALSFHAYAQWTVLGQNARVSWPLSQIALFGGRSAAHKLAAQIRSLSTDKLLDRALDALVVLARLEGDSALVHLATLAESAKSPRVRVEARRLLDATAQERGLAPTSLEDLLVPDLGLDEHAQLTLDYGPRRVEVRLDARLAPVLRDERGERLAQLPRPTKADDPDKAAAATEAYKAFKADAEGAAKAQLRRFERAMCTGHTWSREVFEARVVGHPVLRTLASGLVWTARVGQTWTSFRVAEDRSFAGPDDESVVLPAEAEIAIPHPLALDAALRARWGNVLGDYEIVQPFAQLARETFELTDTERGAATLERVVGKKGEVGHVYALEQRGWSVSGARSWVTALRRALSAATIELRFTDAIDLGRPKETPEVTVAQLAVVSSGGVVAGGAASPAPTFARLTPVEASEILRDLSFLT